jgi:hypothetical protein
VVAVVVLPEALPVLAERVVVALAVLLLTRTGRLVQQTLVVAVVVELRSATVAMVVLVSLFFLSPAVQMCHFPVVSQRKTVVMDKLLERTRFIPLQKQTQEVR